MHERGTSEDSRIAVHRRVRETHTKLVSLIRELERTLGVAQTHEIVSMWAKREAIRDVRSRVSRVPGGVREFADVKRLIREWVKELEETGMEMLRIVGETETEMTISVTSCVMADVFGALDARDVGYVLYCKQDFDAARAIDPRVGLRRAHTLMQGHECCDFTYFWEEQH
ncbi:MAG: L-2-amino-thiazoline-4-carboxylic acid hydrolase [Candidatus Thorarchaeota archaeon]